MYKPTNTPMRITDLHAMKSGRSTNKLLAAFVAIAMFPMSLTANAQDTEPPVIEPIPKWLIDCGFPPPDPRIVDAYDAVSGYDVYVEWIGDSYVKVNPCGFDIHRTYSATDPSGNTAYAEQLIEIRDFTPPTVLTPWDIEVKCGDSVPDPGRDGIAWHIHAWDNCDEWHSLTYVWVGDTQFGTGCGSTIEREYVVSDTCGNETFVIQTIRISRGKGGGGFPKGDKGGGKKK